MIDRKTFAGALTAALSWTVGYSATLALGQGMSGVSAYAVLVGWCLTAYVSSSLALPISAVIPLSAGYFVVFLVATTGGQSWFYKDAYSLTLPAALGIGLAQTLAVCSPIVFDWLVRRAIRICSKRNR